MGRLLAGAALAVLLLAGCGSGHERRDGAILFTRDGRGAAVDPDGRHARLLADPRTASDAVRSPDGRTIAYTDLGGAYSAIGLLDVATGRRTRLTHPPAFANDSDPRWSPDGAPAWSPSGRRLAVAVGSPAAIWVVDPGGGATPLSIRGADPTWEPRGLPATALRGAPLAHRYTAPPDGR